MEQRFTREFFYGSAIAALTGLVFGLMLHAPWQKHPGGPQILFSRAEAAEPARLDAADPITEAPAPASAEVAEEDNGPVPPNPLPVTRLHPEMFDVQPAAAGDEQREDVDDAVDDAVPQDSPRGFD